jgi:hypothetical protein
VATTGGGDEVWGVIGVALVVVEVGATEPSIQVKDSHHSWILR